MMNRYHQVELKLFLSVTLVIVSLVLLVAQDIRRHSQLMHVYAVEQSDKEDQSALQGSCPRWTPVSMCYPQLGAADGRFALRNDGTTLVLQLSNSVIGQIPSSIATLEEAVVNIPLASYEWIDEVYVEGVGSPTRFNVRFYLDVGGVPDPSGARHCSYDNVIATPGSSPGTFTIPLSPYPCSIGAGWLTVQAVDAPWAWLVEAPATGSEMLVDNAASPPTPTPTSTPTNVDPPTATPNGATNTPTSTPTNSGPPTLTPNGPTNTPTSTPMPTPGKKLIATAACNGPDLEVNITSGQGPFNITAQIGVNQPVLGVDIGLTIVEGAEKWDGLAISETTGNSELLELGQYKCRSDERPTLLSPAHRTRTTNRYPTFIWQGITGASDYRLFIFDNTTVANRSVDIRQNSGGPTQFTLGSPLPYGRLFWRVRGRQNHVWSLWSSRYTLFIDP